MTVLSVPFVDLKRQFQPLLPEISKAMHSVIERTAFINGPEVKAFEGQMARWMGVREVCGVSNGTHALALTLQALGVGPGDEVITVPNTAFPTSEAIHLAGARVVFADIGPGSFNLDPECAADAITPRTRAIISVHLFGIPADMAAFKVLAQKHDLFIIEDCAQAQGAKYNGKRVGTLGDAGCFSFFPSKNLGSFGDGGAVASDNEMVIKNVRMMANHGREDKFTHLVQGTNSRLDTLKAAQLSVCLESLDDWNQQRREAVAVYETLLKPYEEITLPAVPDGCEAIWHLYVIRYARRDALAAYLNGRGIKTGFHYPRPLHLQPVYASLGLSKGSFPRAEAACDQLLSLPMFPGITREEIETVARAIIDFLTQAKEK